MKYDLESRTLKFGESVIGFCRSLKMDTITKPLISQLVRAATSAGANYCEANGASSKKDFKNKIHICKKEIQETKYWLKIIGSSGVVCGDKLDGIEKEAHELTLIFNKIIYTLSNSDN